MKIREQKELLRRDLIKHRQALTRRDVNNISQTIINHCISFIPWGKVRSLHTYGPIAEQNEINTWPLLKYIWEDQPHVTTLVPVMVKQKMLNVAVNAKTKWRKNKFGIPEPTNATVSLLFHQFDFIIVPALGFDKNGYRLGYGKGYYDKFLAKQPHATTIGLAYANAEAKTGLPVEPHDVKLNNIVTESGVVEPIPR